MAGNTFQVYMEPRKLMSFSQHVATGLDWSGTCQIRTGTYLLGPGTLSLTNKFHIILNGIFYFILKFLKNHSCAYFGGISNQILKRDILEREHVTQ